ncbi:MAG: Rrf2 family transcriptional regulator [Bacteroidales bacterium]|nr:Rrf2 family transcriptional regulator [Bacteroidales bacterium]
MKLSKTSEYAIRILSFMAKSDKELHSAKYLLEQIDIPQKYMRRIMTDLSKNKFITSVQGRDGGYFFSKEIKDIFLIDIIDAVEGVESYIGCVLGFHECSDENPCAMHLSWVKTRDEIINTLTNTSLANIKNNDIFKY